MLIANPNVRDLFEHIPDGTEVGDVIYNNEFGCYGLVVHIDNQPSYV